MASDSDQDGFDFEEMFEEPADFRPAPPPEKLVVFERVGAGSPAAIKINLLGTHPLWGHHLWNAAKVFATYLDMHPDVVANKTVLELGAAGALPSMIAAANHARHVVITDYPDADLLQNIRTTCGLNFPQSESLVVAGHRWGHEIDKIRALNHGEKYDVLILCDLVFNHSEHPGLLRSVIELMAENGRAYVFFTHHRPWLVAQDLAFLDRAKENGLKCERVVEEYTGAMFEDDPGDERVRGTVHGFELSFA
ncbi:Protein N-terminal and lysine N-methyltransferase efm7 [Coemansia sp. RSA 2618]|nr:Protein N-terminal and lysine N-methyltransferase efm7 [Coemansia sp. RSA 2618]